MRVLVINGSQKGEISFALQMIIEARAQVRGDHPAGAETDTQSNHLSKTLALYKKVLAHAEQRKHI